MDKVVWASCALHSWLRIRNPQSVIALVDKEDESGDVVDGLWHTEVSRNRLESVKNLGSNNYTRDAEKI